MNCLICVEAIGEDGGRSAEVGCRKQASNHLKRLSLRVMVVSVEEKANNDSSGVVQRDE
ncbi:hypothetical protein [Endozoicomonas euniceicola]|uniref:Uncharacterized protein n=1 Tax=Endozoicomonas euniceicola TaxID=1234143 RepID=A0ABY6GS42_9GAMM|nr:hypothetical protein [Endozoicomonas euniceicola]UYM15569.1 hypothetical protein NX720_22445 [Endozoicomonas euniceicola]